MGFVDSMLSDDFFITHAKTRGFGFIDEAVQETARETARETAVRMLRDGEPYDRISRWLLLTEDEIAEIDRSLQLEASTV
jgi:hypothetical protein